MNRVHSIFTWIIFLLAGNIIAQPTFHFPTAEYDAGENFCIPVTVDDFTDITSMDFVITFNAASIEFTGVQGFHPNMSGQGFGAGSFDASNAANGRLVVSWSDPDGSGVTILPDGSTLFELCFKAKGSFGDNSSICIEEDNPIPIITRTGTSGINIGLFQEKGLIGVEVLPVLVEVNNPSGNQGDFVCVDFRVHHFVNIVGLQFSIEFDTALLEYNNWSNYNVLNQLSNSSFSLPAPGVVGLAWFTINDPVTLNDSVAVFGLCFRLKGDCNRTSEINITGNWISLEATTSDEPGGGGTNIGVISEDGSLRINPCNNTGGVTFNGTCPEGMPGETVCVDISIEDFNDINETNYLINWNSTILEYVSHSIEAPGYNANINTSAAALGNIRVDWRHMPPTRGLTLADGTVLLRLCFKIIGTGTAGTTVAVTGSPAVIRRVGSAQNIGLNTNNGCVLVNAPPGLTLSAGDYEGFQGDQHCIDVQVANFNSITKLEFTIEFSPVSLRLDNVTNINIPGVTAANFTDLGNGSIVVQWESATGFGETLPDGTVAFSLCFTLIGEPAADPSLPDPCSSINFTGNEIPININNEENGDFNIGLNEDPGTICILNPGKFTVVGSHETGDLGDVVCVDVKVANFNLITSLQFSVNWVDLTLISFESLELTGAIPGLTNSNFDFSGVDIGLLSLSWMDPTGMGVTLPDSTVIFRVCYKIIGDANASTPINFDRNPLEIRVTSALTGDDNIGLVNRNGSVSSNDYLRILSLEIIDVDCPDDMNGSINLVITGGQAPYTYQWMGISADTRSITNIGAGIYSILVTDSANPPTILRDTFEVTISGNAPVANAGADRGMNCNSTPVKLNGTASSTGSGFTYLWRTLDTGGVVPPSDRTLEPTVTGPGTYVLEVTGAGCTSYDTVVVSQPVNPVANGGGDQSINCLTSEAELNASGSQGNNLRYTWQVIGGNGMLLPGTENSVIAVALTSGTYEVSILEIQTGCSGKDTVEVLNDTLPPIADAGPQMSIGCLTDTLVLGGNMTSSGPEFEYEWSEITNGNIIGPIDEQAVEVNATGVYQLIVTNTSNGCADTSTVIVDGDPNRPQADAGNSIILTCTMPVARLDGSGSSTGDRYVYEWTALGGGSISPAEKNTINPQVSTPGIYQLMVRDTISGCEDFSTVTVTSNQSYPTVSAGIDWNLGCRNFEVILEGLVNPYDTAFMDIQWTTDIGSILSGDTTTNPTVLGEGSYYIEVTDLRNGCQARDTVEVFQDTTGKPLVVIQPLSPTQKLTCKDSMVQLNAIGSSNGSQFLLSWTPVNGIISGANTLTPRVNKAGTYRLEIVNTQNGCISSKTINVERDTMRPSAVIDGTDLNLPCEPPTLELDASGSSASGSSFTVAWSALGGSPITGATTLRPTVENPDTYQLIITNSRNGCKDTTSVNVSPNDNPITAQAGNDLELNCMTSEFTVTGTGSTVCDCIEYEWSLSGTGVVSTELGFTLNEQGEYILFMRDTTDGCTAADTLVVGSNLEEPTVDAGEDQLFNCTFENTSLEGSSNAGGDPVTIAWTNPDGNQIDNPNTLNPLVYESGIYILSVTNDVNGCEARDTVEITVQSNLDPASASIDGDMCQDFALLNGNLPANVSGEWSTPGDADIEFPGQSSTMANQLETGENIFIWTLSTDDCPDYSRDTVAVTIAGLPSLRNDLAEMEGDQDTIAVNLVLNDNISGVQNPVFDIVNGPSSGLILDFTNGILTYERQEDFFGSVDIYYAVCNPVCPNFCDTAFLKLTIERASINTDSLPPNAITPNDDGKNDVLIFDELYLTPELYPNNEFIVFNRWGDVVYQAQPYFNNWAGTNQNGNDLPEGTYYYILRLSVAQSKILRGDVTILR